MNKPAEKLELTAHPRKEGLSPRALRKQGEIPAVVYGKDSTPASLTVNWADFHKVYQSAGETTIINLEVNGSSPQMVLIKEVQLSPDTDEYLNIDFYKVRAGEKLRVTVPLKFIGEAPAIKNFGGILVTNKNEIEVECLPQDLPHEIVVDLSHLENIDDAIFVKDLLMGSGVEVLDQPEDSIVVVTPPAAEEVEPVVSEEEAVAAVEAMAEKTEEEISAAETSGEEEKKEE